MHNDFQWNDKSIREREKRMNRITTAMLCIATAFITVHLFTGINFGAFTMSDAQAASEPQYTSEYQQTTDHSVSDVQNQTRSASLANFDPAEITNMSAMFENCPELTEIDVSGFDPSEVTNMSAMFADSSELDLDLAEHEAVFVEPVIEEHSFAESVMSYLFVAILAALFGILSVIGVTNIPQIWQQFKTKRNIQRMTKEKERKMREALQKELEAKKDDYIVYMSYLTTECHNIEKWAEYIQDGEIKTAISQICDSLQFIIEHTDRDEYKTANFAKLRTYYIPEFKNLLQSYYKCENSIKFGYMHSDTKAHLKKIILKAADIFKITAQESIAKEISEMDSSALAFECKAMQDGLMQDALQEKLHPLV